MDALYETQGCDAKPAIEQPIPVGDFTVQRWWQFQGPQISRNSPLSGGPKGGHLKGGHLKMGFRTESCTRHVDFALKVALDTSILTALSKAIPNGPNTVSESTVSTTELSELFGPQRVPGRELSEFLSAYYLCAKANSPSFLQNSTNLPPNSMCSLFRNRTLETVCACFVKDLRSPATRLW